MNFPPKLLIDTSTAHWTEMPQLVTQQTVNQNNSYKRVSFEHMKFIMEEAEIIFKKNFVLGFRFLNAKPPRM